MQNCAVALGKHGIRANAILPGTVATDINKEDLKNTEKRDYMINRTLLGRLGSEYSPCLNTCEGLPRADYCLESPGGHSRASGVSGKRLGEIHHWSFNYCRWRFVRQFPMIQSRGEQTEGWNSQLHTTVFRSLHGKFGPPEGKSNIYFPSTNQCLNSGTNCFPLMITGSAAIRTVIHRAQCLDGFLHACMVPF